MKTLVLENQKINVDVADHFWTRLKGLLGTRSLPADRALLILPCNSVHMMGMKYAIDVVYLNQDNVVIKIVENLKPWLGISYCFQATGVLEIGSGMAKAYHLQLGQKLFA